jgi:hypothetical protein
MSPLAGNGTSQPVALVEELLLLLLLLLGLWLPAPPKRKPLSTSL